jgi:hypothetical protein
MTRTRSTRWPTGATTPNSGKLRPDRIDYGGLLPDEEVTSTISIKQLCCSAVSS